MNSVPPLRILHAALSLADHGFTPIPVCDGRPIMKAWTQAAPGKEEARERFIEHSQCDGVAVLTGGGFFAIDLDRHGAGDGIASMAELVAANGPLPQGPRVQSPRGLHLWFSAPSDVIVRNAVGVRAGFDVRGERGCIVCPPSVRSGGGFYKWLAPLHDRPPLAPDWLLALVRERPIASGPVVAPREFVREHPFVRSGFDRALFALSGMAPSSGRNEALFKVGARFFGFAAAGHISLVTVERCLFNAAVANGLVGDDGEEAVRATIASARRHGEAAPRDPPPQTKRREPAEARAV